VFDLSPFKLLVLAVIALVVFGPYELPKIAAQAGRMLRELRRIAEGAKADLREGLGPEYQDFDFEDLNPRRFVQKHLLDDMADSTRPLMDEFRSTSDAVAGSAATIGAAATGAAAGAALANGTSATLLDGAEPPFDLEAT
jgi:sec-independent protein translocase protein TatB